MGTQEAEEENLWEFEAYLGWSTMRPCFKKVDRRAFPFQPAHRAFDGSDFTHPSLSTC